MGLHRMGDRRRPQSCKKVLRAGRNLNAHLGAENPGICPWGSAPPTPSQEPIPAQLGIGQWCWCRGLVQRVQRVFGPCARCYLGESPVPRLSPDPPPHPPHPSSPGEAVEAPAAGNGGILAEDPPVGRPKGEWGRRPGRCLRSSRPAAASCRSMAARRGNRPPSRARGSWASPSRAEGIPAAPLWSGISDDQGGPSAGASAMPGGGVSWLERLSRQRRGCRQHGRDAGYARQDHPDDLPRRLQGARLDRAGISPPGPDLASVLDAQGIPPPRRPAWARRRL